MLAALPDAGGVLVVNNGAAALLMALTVLAAGREVVRSRGELVEIGDGFRLPDSAVTTGAVRWYLWYGLSCRDVEELVAERGVEVDHVTVYRWVQHFTPLLVDAARPCRHRPGDRWFVDETYLKISGRWRYLYRAVDGQVIDVYLSTRRDIWG